MLPAKKNNTFVFYIVCETVNLTLLSRTLTSFYQQHYSYWQLIVIGSNACKKYIKANKKISFLQYPENDPIFFFMNTHIKQQDQTKTHYIGILSQGETIKHTALYAINNRAGESPYIIYSDDDSSLADGHTPLCHFKPDWNPDYFASYNYINSALVIQPSLFYDAPPPLPSRNCIASYLYGIIQHHFPTLNTCNVLHIPEILFHLVQKKHNPPFSRPSTSTQAAINKLILKENTLVSLIIPTRDEFLMLQKCIQSIVKKTDYPHYEIIIIDNNSKEHSAIQYLKTLQQRNNIRVLPYPKKFNYSAINNMAVQHAKGTVIGFINNDIEVKNSHWLNEMLQHACRPDIGCVGAKLYYPDGTIQHGGVILGIKGTASHAHKYFSGEHSGYFGRLSVVHNVSAVTAACLLMRKDLFHKVGGFDEVNLKVAYNDVDLCLKVLSLGYRNLWTPYAELIHYESKSRGKKRSWWQRRKLRKEARFLQKKWGGLLLNDPAYNPNLTLDREDFSPKENI